jgi:anti-anti-sigma regulatory factor
LRAVAANIREVIHAKDRCGMLKITIVEDARRRRLIVEGKLIAPWAAELATAYQTAKADLQNRELIVDLRSLTAISSEGEDVLLQLIHEKVKFLCGVYVKEVLRQLGRRRRGSLRDGADKCVDSDI